MIKRKVFTCLRNYRELRRSNLIRLAISIRHNRHQQLRRSFQYLLKYKIAELNSTFEENLSIFCYQYSIRRGINRMKNQAGILNLKKYRRSYQIRLLSLTFGSWIRYHQESVASKKLSLTADNCYSSNRYRTTLCKFRFNSHGRKTSRVDDGKSSRFYRLVSKKKALVCWSYNSKYFRSDPYLKSKEYVESIPCRIDLRVHKYFRYLRNKSQRRISLAHRSTVIFSEVASRVISTLKDFVYKCNQREKKCQDLDQFILTKQLKRYLGFWTSWTHFHTQYSSRTCYRELLIGRYGLQLFKKRSNFLQERWQKKKIILQHSDSFRKRRMWELFVSIITHRKSYSKDNQPKVIVADRIWYRYKYKQGLCRWGNYILTKADARGEYEAGKRHWDSVGSFMALSRAFIQYTEQWLSRRDDVRQGSRGDSLRRRLLLSRGVSALWTGGHVDQQRISSELRADAHKDNHFVSKAFSKWVFTCEQTLDRRMGLLRATVLWKLRRLMYAMSSLRSHLLVASNSKLEKNHVARETLCAKIESPATIPPEVAHRADVGGKQNTTEIAVPLAESQLAALGGVSPRAALARMKPRTLSAALTDFVSSATATCDLLRPMVSSSLHTRPADKILHEMLPKNGSISHDLTAPVGHYVDPRAAPRKPKISLLKTEINLTNTQLQGKIHTHSKNTTLTSSHISTPDNSLIGLCPDEHSARKVALGLELRSFISEVKSMMQLQP